MRAKRAAVFRKVGALNPQRAAFDLSHRVLTTGDMGVLYPITNYIVTAGDRFKIFNDLVIRFQPMFSPVLHEIWAYLHWFFVPFRILWSYWEEYRTGGRDGRGAIRRVLPVVDLSGSTGTVANTQQHYFRKGGLFDFLYGVVARTDVSDTQYPVRNLFRVANKTAPIDFPVRAYIKIYNEYYRDENLVDEYPIPWYNTDNAVDYTTLKGLFKRSWSKDYFTSALPDQQRGDPPAFPLTGLASVDGVNLNVIDQVSVNPNMQLGLSVNNNPYMAVPNPPGSDALKDFFGGLTVNMENVPTFDVSDLRNAVQLQKYLERNMRAGYKYTEWLRARFNVSPSDARLDRPEYIGGSKHPCIISEVLQTSGSGEGIGTGFSPQANMAGHGLSADSSYIGNYLCKEDGIIMAILSVMPTSVYSQGLNKQYIKRNPYEFIIPEFAHVSEKAVEQLEIRMDQSNTLAQNTQIFGYQGQYDEFRYQPSRIGGDFRFQQQGGSLSYWHLSRYFANRVYLNRSFVECDPESTKRIYNAQTADGLMISFSARVKAVRPLPSIAEPGLVDHF